MATRQLQLFADGVSPNAQYINKIMDDFGIYGFTCNPTLIKQHSPITYTEYCNKILTLSRGTPVSVQVIASSLSEICEQARKISSWGSNVYVKIPIINEYGESTSNIVKELIQEKIKVNVTAVFTEDQVRSLLDAGLNNNDDCVISVFCGRILDTGIYPNTTIKNIDDMLIHSFGTRGNIKILWAGVRSGIDIHLAKEYCDIITLPSSVIDKMSLRGKNLDDYTLDTVKMFANDSKNFNLD